MKLAFSTLGCPNWNLDTIISKSKQWGYDGIEFRGYLGQTDIFNLPEFSSGVEQTTMLISDSRLEVPCFSSSAQLLFEDPEKIAQSIAEVEKYSRLCSIFKTPYIRIFVGLLGNYKRQEAIAIVSENLQRMAWAIDNYDVKLLIETHDDWVRSDYLKKILQAVDLDNVGILWDAHHPYRLAGESPEYTWNNLRHRIFHVHLKDSIREKYPESSYALVPLGSGDLPIKSIVHVLKEGGYNGYVSYEWEKMWHPEIEEPEVVFSVYIETLKSLMQE